MPNLLDIRRRIRSVRNTQQITQAMKMVSAAKLRRAQEQALAARPYARQIGELLNGLAPFLDPQALADARLPGEEWALSALLAQPPVRKRLIIVITTDSGLVGGFNANVIKAALAAAQGAGSGAAQNAAAVSYDAVGRKGRDALKRRGAELAAERIGVFTRGVDPAAAPAIAVAAMRAFATGAVDEVLITGNQFKSVLQQTLVTQRLLPFELAGSANAPGAGRDYIFETPPVTLLAQLLPRAIEARVQAALLESLAAEHAARMNAMEAATSNAGELIDTLTLNMNRVRQAAITKEIIEVVSGAAAAQG